ncbi:unnamed protein product [Eruca vesicaria subsp. sativa]|uniref:Uncharacterized protein n=1 Tax=Eruca vesicaria subsp. sativa TaxID=29727 RepID=A0ABC8KWN5_ERUVS|nr:unnamed protein product [Eruca vesicaria subsp. sativa]
MACSDISPCACLPETNKGKRRLPRIGFEPMLEDNHTSFAVREDGSTSPSSHKHRTSTGTVRGFSSDPLEFR